MLLVDALYINNSGGKVLLDYFVAELDKTNAQVYYLFDDRCMNDYSFISADKKTFLKAGLKSRKTFYKTNKDLFSKVFCFGNIPPPTALKAPVYTYFHNVSLLSQPSNYSWKERTLKYVKGLAIKHFSKNTDYFIVQTNDVKKLLISKDFAKPQQCLILPFFYSPGNEIHNAKQPSFVYISNGNTHKNHSKLIEAWYLLAKKNLFPPLHLTITANYQKLVDAVSKAENEGLKILNHGFTKPDDLYNQNEFLIYPSLCESFGLGLIEAVTHGCNVIASDLPFVYEVIKPTAVFNPLDAQSIADTVEQVLKNKPCIKTQLIVENKINELITLLTR